MTQINGKDYHWRLKSGDKGIFYWPGRPPTPVTFMGMLGVYVIVKGHGVRRKWHTGLHGGHLQGAFSWDIGG